MAVGAAVYLRDLMGLMFCLHFCITTLVILVSIKIRTTLLFLAYY
jgi:hypothetical protein